MTRKSVVTFAVFALTFGVGVASFYVLTTINKTSVAPHIIVLVADDLGIGYAPCHASKPYMPFLSSLCNRAVVFKRAYTHPVCTPSRATMMTGRHPFRTGVWEPWQNARKLAASEITLPEIIRLGSDVPYRFASFGKWHLADDDNGGNHNPNIQGFDHYEGNPRQHFTYTYLNYEWTVNGKVEERSVKTYKTTHIVNKVIAHFEDTGEDGPWLYWIGFVNPHLPFHLPPVDLHDYDDLGPPAFKSVTHTPKGPLEVQINRSAPQVVPYFRAMIQALDTEIARLVDALGTKTDRPILFVFLGDNGDAGEVSTLSEPGLVRAKATLYEGGVRVPLMVWRSDTDWIESFAREDQRLVHLADLFPTLAEIAGVAPDEVRRLVPILDGVPFTDALAERDRRNVRDFIYIQKGGFIGEGSFSSGAVAGDGIKLILYKFSSTDQGAPGKVKVYDVVADPGERKNLFPQICKTNRDGIWRLFKFIEKRQASEESRYRKTNEEILHDHIISVFNETGCFD